MAMPEWGIVNNYFSVYGRAEVTFNQRGGCRFVRRISLSHRPTHSTTVSSAVVSWKYPPAIKTLVS